MTSIPARPYTPALKPELLLHAAGYLEDSDVVLIPATDGGVTLMGCSEPWPELQQLPWVQNR